MGDSIELDFLDSLVVKVINPSNVEYTVKTSNEFVVGASNSRLAGMYKGDATVYLETDHIVDSIAVHCTGNSKTNMVPLCLDFDSTVEDVMEYERSQGLSPRDKICYNHFINKSVHLVTSPRMLSGTQIGGCNL